MRSGWLDAVWRVLPAAVLLAAGGCRHDWDKVTITPYDAGTAGDAALDEAGGGGVDGGGADGGGADGDAGPTDLSSDQDSSDFADQREDAAKATCDPTDVPSDTDGVFVSPGGSATGDGTRANPLSTIKAGLAAALAAGQSIVYLDAGVYPEAVTVGANFTNGVSLLAGWTVTGTSWARNCMASRREQTTVAAPGATGVAFVGVTGAIVLRDFTITTETQGGATALGGAETVVGLSLRSDSGHITLTNMHVTAGAAGAGPAQSQPPAGGNMSCSGIGDCSGGAVGTTPPSGAPGPAGSIVAGLYVPGDGVAGGPGSAGQNGTSGAPGMSNACFTGCTGGGSVTCVVGTCTITTAVSTSPAGSCGCAGLGGAAGAAGRGGGASIGLLAHGNNVVVDAHNSLIEAGVGGDGSAGGLAGAGGPGTTGANGAAISCQSGSCVAKLSSSICSCVPEPTAATLAGGNAGGKGGKGGSGSAGGGGAGGWSYAVITSLGAQVSTDGMTTLKHGVAGSGQGGAPDGQVGDIIGI